MRRRYCPARDDGLSGRENIQHPQQCPLSQSFHYQTNKKQIQQPSPSRNAPAVTRKRGIQGAEELGPQSPSTWQHNLSECIRRP